MPTILRPGPYRFFFYSAHGFEPPHVHVEREDRVANVWLEPVRFQDSGGFAGKELRVIEELVKDNADLLLREWHGFFGKRA